MILGLIAKYDPRELLICGGELFTSCDNALGITMSPSIAMQTSRDTKQVYDISYRPSIVMKLSDSRRLPRFNANTLLHEERHVLQACRPLYALPKSQQALEELDAQVAFRDEVEAHHQDAIYKKVVGIASASWLDDMREDLGIPVIGPDEPFDAYIPLVDKLGKEGLAWLHGKRPAHSMDTCCLHSLMMSRLQGQLVRSNHLRGL